MDEVILIKVEVDDPDWLEDQEVLSFFPEHYSPSLIESEEGQVVDVLFSGGKGRFTFNEHEVECHFEYYDDDEDYDNEWSEYYGYTANAGICLVKYVSEEISNITGFTTSYAQST